MKSGSCRRAARTCSPSTDRPAHLGCSAKRSKSHLRRGWPAMNQASRAALRPGPIRRHPLMRPWSYERLAEGVVLFLLAHGRGGAVAGKENESLGQCQDAFPDTLQVNRVERGGVSPPDGAGEERVADEHVRVRLVAHPARRMAGGGHQADLFPAQLKRVPLARERAQAWRWLPAQQGPVPFPDVHGRWVARQDRGDPARVVGMAVRQADGSERQPVLLDRAEDGLGVVAGVDKDSMTGGRVVVQIPLHGIAADVAVDRDDVLDRVRDGMAWMPPVTGDGGQLRAVEAERRGERMDLRPGRRALPRFKLPQRRRVQTGVLGNLIEIQPQAGARLLDDVVKLVFQHGTVTLPPALPALEAKRCGLTGAPACAYPLLSRIASGGGAHDGR